MNKIDRICHFLEKVIIAFNRINSKYRLGNFVMFRKICNFADKFEFYYHNARNLMRFGTQR